MSQEQLDRIEAKLDRLLNAQPKRQIEPAVDLDSEWGDPKVHSDPKNWTNDHESNKGKKYSECTPEYLDRLAGLLQWQAGKDDEQKKVTAKGQPTSSFKLKDAARALGWAKRLRERTPVGIKQNGSVMVADEDESDAPF